MSCCLLFPGCTNWYYLFVLSSITSPNPTPTQSIPRVPLIFQDSAHPGQYDINSPQGTFLTITCTLGSPFLGSIEL